METSFAQLTLICLSYERQAYIRRQIAYFSTIPITLIVADGSSRPLTNLDVNDLKNFRLRFKYIHLAGAETYLQRMHLALEQVDTSFVMLMDDADI